jgi:RNA polymerase sigma factor (sigma-70 family)
MSKHEAFEIYQPLLYSIALKMVGRLEDAEDIVQDTFEKWLKIDSTKISNAKAYLITSVKNNSVKFMNSLRERVSHQSVCDTDHNALAESAESKGIFNFDIEVEVNHAWETLHSKLEPLEKSIFVMREVFNVEYEELQQLYDKKVDNLRKIVSRAKTKLQEEKKRFQLPNTDSYIPDSFKRACSGGQLSDLFHELTEDIKERLK